MAARIKKNDVVYILSGKDKGRTGKVLEVNPSAHECVVEKVNVVKRHQKARSGGQPAGIVEKAMPISLAKVMLFDETTKKPSRIRMEGKGSDKKRVFVKSGKAAA